MNGVSPMGPRSVRGDVRRVAAALLECNDGCSCYFAIGASSAGRLRTAATPQALLAGREHPDP